MEAHPAAAPPSRECNAIDPSTLALDEADGLALGLRLLRDRLALALGRTLALFTEREAWKENGYARQSDYAREKLGRSSRWLRDMARLGAAVERYPRLASVLTGEDGGIPLGVAATLEIAAVADAEANLPAEARQAAVGAGNAAAPEGGIGRGEKGAEASADPELCEERYRRAGQGAGDSADEEHSQPVGQGAGSTTGEEHLGGNSALAAGAHGWMEIWIARARNFCLRQLRTDAASAKADARRESPALSRKAICLGYEGVLPVQGGPGRPRVTREVGGALPAPGRRGAEGETEEEAGNVPGTREEDPEGNSEAGDHAQDRTRRYTVRLGLPPEAAAAFEEVLDLHRAVSGGETTVSSFIEALVAEYRAGTDAAGLGAECSDGDCGDTFATLVPASEPDDCRAGGAVPQPEGNRSTAGDAKGAHLPGEAALQSEGICSATVKRQDAQHPEADDDLDLDDQLWMKLQQRRQERAAEREARLAEACDHWKQWPQDGAAASARIAEHEQARALLEEVGRLVTEATRGLGSEGGAANSVPGSAGAGTGSSATNGARGDATSVAGNGPASSAEDSAAIGTQVDAGAGTGSSATNGARGDATSSAERVATIGVESGAGGSEGSAEDGGTEGDLRRAATSNAEGNPATHDRFRVFTGSSGTDAVTLHRRIRRLMAADRRIEIVLGELLASMADRRAWGRWHPAPWRFENIAHYAEERLGISRSRAWQMVRVARRCRRLPQLRRAYQSGKASLEAVLLVLRVLGKGPVDEALERRWTERACRSTIKRLRDEVRELKRGPLPAAPGAAPPEPLTDDAWFRSVARPPGRSYRRVQKLWKRAERTFARQSLRRRMLYLYLEEDLADEFRDVLSAAARQAVTDPRFPDPAPPPRRPSLLAPRERRKGRPGAPSTASRVGSRPDPESVQTFSASEGFRDALPNPPGTTSPNTPGADPGSVQTFSAPEGSPDSLPNPPGTALPKTPSADPGSVQTFSAPEGSPNPLPNPPGLASPEIPGTTPAPLQTFSASQGSPNPLPNPPRIALPENPGADPGPVQTFSASEGFREALPNPPGTALSKTPSADPGSVQTFSAPEGSSNPPTSSPETTLPEIPGATTGPLQTSSAQERPQAPPSPVRQCVPALDPELDDSVPNFDEITAALRRRPKLWRGLMVLLTDYCATWDPPELPRAISPRRRNEQIYVRDGYRCTAPGCTSRQHLEDHHIRYRSRGGGDEPANRTTLCAFHHLRGEHGGLMQVTGSAPTGLDFRLGPPDIDSERFRNELRPDP